MSLWMCLLYGRLTSLLAAQQAVPFHQPILPCTVACAQSSSRCQHQLQDLSLPQHRLKANAQPQGWGEVLFSIFLPCFLPPFQTPACLWQTALVCMASGSQGNAECWCPHFCFQGSKAPKSTVVANILTPLLCRHHTLHKPEASSCPLCKCSPQDSTHSPCSSVTIHYSSQLLEQAYELTAEKQHHPYAMESCLRQKIKSKIKRSHLTFHVHLLCATAAQDLLTQNWTTEVKKKTAIPPVKTGLIHCLVPVTTSPRTRTALWLFQPAVPALTKPCLWEVSRGHCHPAPSRSQPEHTTPPPADELKLNNCKAPKAKARDQLNADLHPDQ